MISKKYKCIFVHIPKNAGQSIEHFFLNLHGLTWENRSPLLLKYNPDSKKGPQRLAHLMAKEYVEYGYVNENDFNSYFKFAFVRNPWSRLVSEFFYRNYQKKWTFKEFVLGGLPKKNLYDDSYRHIIPQSQFLYGDSGEMLVNFVGKFENLQKDFDFVCSKLNIQESTLPHVNSSSIESRYLQRIKKLLFRKKPFKKLHYTEYYDKETKDIVQDMYAEDILKFGYEFGS